MTTLNLQVSASTDDGYYSDDAGTGTQFGDTGIGLYTGWNNTSSAWAIINGWHRFSGIGGLIIGATINTADFSLWGFITDTGVPLTDIFAEDAAAPTVPETQLDADGRTRTTAFVAWDSPGLSASAFTSKSCVSVIQELVDSYSPSAIQILHDDGGSDSGDDNYIFCDTWNRNTEHAAKLDIDFTPAPIPVIKLYGFRQRVA